jgi:hypothetical protein
MIKTTLLFQLLYTAMSCIIPLTKYVKTSSQGPLTSITLSKASLNGTHLINKPLIKLRKKLELRCSVILCYPDFNKWFPFHNFYKDATDHHLGIVIMQDRKPIAFYS